MLDYTNALYAEFKLDGPSVTSAVQLVVTKDDGPNEDGWYNPSVCTRTFIPAAQITSSTAFGQKYLEFDVTVYSEFWIHTGSGVLPLKFLSFNAQYCNKNSVCLNWKTANEQNVSHFEIERSGDGIVFKTVGTKTANNQLANSYTSVDDISAFQNSRQIFYRIKKIDSDGKFSYSTAQIVKPFGKNPITVYPNPASETVNIRGWNNIKQMQLYDVSGRLLNEWQLATPSININNLMSGTYLLKLRMKTGEILQEKIIKK